MTTIPNIPHASVIEARIVGRLVADILAAGYSVDVWTGGDEPDLADCKDAATIFAALSSSDQDELTLNGPNGYAGMILLVWGNDDAVISDYSVRLEDVMAAANKLAEDLGGGAEAAAEDERPSTILDATTSMCVFWQNESARAYEAARWEYENGALSRTPAAQERAAALFREVEVRLSRLLEY